MIDGLVNLSKNENGSQNFGIAHLSVIVYIKISESTDQSLAWQALRSAYKQQIKELRGLRCLVLK